MSGWEAATAARNRAEKTASTARRVRWTRKRERRLPKEKRRPKAAV
jgi:hypothetical protein